VDSSNLDKFLSVRRYDFGLAAKKNQVGQVTGLAWTEVGGDLLTIEAAVMPGKGNTIRTGSLGDVMKESVEAARSVVRSRGRKLGIAGEAFEKKIFIFTSHKVQHLRMVHQQVSPSQQHWYLF